MKTNKKALNKQRTKTEAEAIVYYAMKLLDCSKKCTIEWLLK